MQINNVVNHLAMKSKKLKKNVVLKIHAKEKLKKNKKSSKKNQKRQLNEEKMLPYAKNVRLYLQHWFIKMSPSAKNVF